MTNSKKSKPVDPIFLGDPEMTIETLSQAHPQIKNEGMSQESIPEALQAPDPFDPGVFAVRGGLTCDVGVVKELVHCPVRKPNRQEFFRVHPNTDYRLNAFILDLNDVRETYLVDPSVAAEMPGEAKIVSLRLTVNRQGAVFLWPVPVPSLDGRENAWWTSARVAAERAESAWTRMVANMSGGAYDVFTASGVLTEPVWPNVALRDILEWAFGERFIIRDTNHPVIRRLMGLE